jgi:hypothetical protein
MRFYIYHPRFYGGIDLHARAMHVFISDSAGTVLLDRQLPCHCGSCRSNVPTTKSS